MFTLGGGAKIYLATGVTDLRRGFSLHILIEQALGFDQPLNGDVFGFVNKRHNLVKLFWFSEGGLYVCANTHAPHCPQWFHCKDSVSIPSALWKGVRGVWLGRRAARCSICAIAE
jgi:hypothetical protein